MIKTIIACDQCKKEIHDKYALKVICEMWNNNLDFCHVNCLTQWVKDRQREMGNCS